MLVLLGFLSYKKPSGIIRGYNTKRIALGFCGWAFFIALLFAGSTKGLWAQTCDEVETHSTPSALRSFQPQLNGQRLLEGVAYGPHRAGQSPDGLQPSDAELLEDLRLIAARWSLLRVYNADDGSAHMLSLIRENHLPLQMMLGVWLEPEESQAAKSEANRRNVTRAIELAREYPELVAAVCAGNETQVYWSWHRMDSNVLLSYLRQVREAIAQPVTTADDYNFWNKPESLPVAAQVDFLCVHAHPLWNSREHDSSTRWLQSVLDDVRELHSGKPLVLGETGWATDYDSTRVGNGEQGTLMTGEVSERAQGEFLLNLSDWIYESNTLCFLFEAFDEAWKGGGSASSPRDAEKHWGVYYENRRPKPSFAAYARRGRNNEMNNEPLEVRKP